MTAYAINENDLQREIEALEAHITRAGYDDKELAEAEKILRRAFRSKVQGSVSTSAFFAGMYRTENKKLLDGSMPAYLIDKEYPDERRDRWATQVHLRETSPAHFSKPPIDQQDYMFTSVHAVVNSLPEQYLVFIKAQYMPESVARGEFLARLLQSFWRGYQPNVTPRINRAVLYVFAQVIVASSGAEDGFLLAGIRSKFSDNRDSWKRSYLPHWRAMQGEFKALRNRSLTAFLAEY
jgi:hypothetical protein